ncbi:MULTISPECIES: 3-deoxy-D-manno-octulosonic acid transferase [Roseobacteraceae]|uniref:3-deoxy-D-manno-octulosonic acid transferase n=1 Tax=Pseudosulfitobacter pseudonitzschiae TaxID=1402135 RepID=A0A221K1D2_9RHOB|nr:MULTISPECIES: 3-deoxy-D-manno-octulosonic acid transferase [Roseobacteraceae]ASM72700.1 3-deoxy-D-manno-octulosonic acid transferase [Pseudosulfitobacter pseudonitzschiae]
MRPTALYRAYVVLAALVVPFAAHLRIRRLRRDGVAVHRAHEILGQTTQQRPGGLLIWFHAASVGESLSVLPLITAIGVQLPQTRFLITSGTPTSAAMIEARMPPRCVHQFAPLDSAGPVKRFLKRWRPDAAVFVESELWPQILVRAHRANVPLAMVGARMSQRSLSRWAKFPRTAAFILGQFRLILTQNDDMAKALTALAPPHTKVEAGFNLKSLSPALPVHGAARSRLAEIIARRPTWVAASTHVGEEADALLAHAHVLQTHPDALLILAPRHPDRGDEVADLIRNMGLTHTRRTEGQEPDAQVFLADTLGEMGLWYALAPFVFLGGSLQPHGGHNPYEVAQAGAAILTGPHLSNFAETFAPLEACGAVQLVADGRDLGERALHWIDTPQALAHARIAASDFVAKRDTGAADIAARLVTALDLGP